MSEPIPESIPTSADPRSNRPTKKRALTPVSKQASSIDALFANPDREVEIPSGPKERTLAPPPEIVTNVQGSSAGAGSGEFHVYKASRRREFERVRMMEVSSEKERQTAEWERKQKALKERDDKKLNKNQARRAKARQNKENAKAKGVSDTNSAGDLVKSLRPKPAKTTDAAGDEHEGDGEVMHPASAAEQVPGIVIHDEE